MKILALACGLAALNFAACDVDTTEETESADEDSDVGLPVVTEEVMNSNIKMNDAADREVAEEIVDSAWDINLAIRDVAYYLRGHKFLDYDHRYYKSAEESPSKLYQDFPKPPLRSLHWEVHRYCDSGFIECLRYLDRVVQLTALKRSDDTITIMKQNNWNLANNSQQILSVQRDCQMAQRRDNLTFAPFQGPIERFQWRTSASYYMCWYTMLETPDLGLFGEFCDNHANCLDIYGANNKDPRADDSKPFACAVYSFCPDHCCPIKHIWYMRDCFQSKDNPCYYNQPGKRKCSLNRTGNRDFAGIMNNQINVSCECHQRGYEWSSRFGLCVDVNECTRGLHNCSVEAGQACFNLPDSFDCVCRFGWVLNVKTGRCEISNIFESILESTADTNATNVDRTVDRIVNVLTRSGASLRQFYDFVIIVISTSVLIYQISAV